MHLLKTQRPVFSSIFDNLVLNNRRGYTSYTNPVDTPSVNVIESDVDYTLQLAAPGKNKEDFAINWTREFCRLPPKMKFRKTIKKKVAHFVSLFLAILNVRLNYRTQLRLIKLKRSIKVGF